MSDRLCSIDGCSKALCARGWCQMHYRRWKNHGDPSVVLPGRNGAGPRIQGVEPCVIEGCTKVRFSRDWCSAHYSRWKRHGAPTARVRGEVVEGRRICAGCGEDKPLSEWTPGSTGRCKACVADAQRSWRQAHPDHWRTPAERARIRAYRARKLTATVEVFDPHEIFERDGWVCGICDRAIDPTLAYPHRLSVSLDHVIPLSRGGEHSRANTQAAHMACNSAKRDRVAA